MVVKNLVIKSLVVEQLQRQPNLGSNFSSAIFKLSDLGKVICLTLSFLVGKM